jgi:hypothetical protein
VVNQQTVWIPGLLVNSPYGGFAAGNITYPVGFLVGYVIGEETGDTNGGAAWAGFLSDVNASTDQNVTTWGPGPNTRCTGPFIVNLSPMGDTATGIPIMGPGNASDGQEPTVLFPGTDSPNNNLSFENGFNNSNEPNVSTCGGPPESLSVTSTFLTLWIHFERGGQNQSVPFELPVSTIQYNYWFPGNYGTWQVEALSNPGGPGGGWAFSFAPCS